MTVTEKKEQQYYNPPSRVEKLIFRHKLRKFNDEEHGKEKEKEWLIKKVKELCYPNTSHSRPMDGSGGVHARAAKQEKGSRNRDMRMCGARRRWKRK